MSDNDKPGEFQLHLERDDALLFRALPDGSMTMVAIPRREWEARLSRSAADGANETAVEAMRRVFHDDGEQARADLVAPRRAF